MLVRCNPKCKLNDGMTECKLNVETNQAICMECGDEVTSVSKFAKLSMKMNKDVIKDKKKRAFTFQCNTCDKSVCVTSKNSKLCGVECETPEKCLINTTESMKLAIINLSEQK